MAVADFLHAHFFFPSYTVTPQGFGEKGKLRELDLKTHSSKIIEELREQWARFMERGFQFQGEDIKLEHRSYERQNEECKEVGVPRIKVQPQPKIGSAAKAMHERGERTDRMELIEEVSRDNAKLKAIEAEEKALELEIERLESLQNLTIPKSCVGTHIIDDHVNQRSYQGTRVYAQRTFDWLIEHHSDEPMLESLFDDFELLLDGPRPEETKVPELPPEPNIGDLFEAVAMHIDRMQLRARPRPQHVKKSRLRNDRGRSEPVMTRFER